MSLSSHIFTFCIIYNCIFYLCGSVEDNKFSDRNGRHLPTLLRFFRGLNNKQNYAQQFQPFYFLPSVLVLPSINQHQNVIYQESEGQENYQEISKNLNLKTHAKLVSRVNNIDFNDTINLDQYVYSNNSNEETNENQSNKLALPYKVLDFTHATFVDTSITEQDYFDEPKTIHPSERTDNNFTNSFSLTNDQLKEYDTNVTLKSNCLQTNKVEHYWGFSGYKSTTENGKKEEHIIQVPTNSQSQTYYLPTDHDFLPKLDEKYTFSRTKEDFLTKKGFKPLAGLYYDGFLHRPLTKVSGFKPI